MPGDFPREHQPCACPQAELVAVEARNLRHKEAQAEAELELLEGEAAIERGQAEMRRREGEIERKAREQDALNRKLEAVLAAVAPGEDAGAARS